MPVLFDLARGRQSRASLGRRYRSRFGAVPSVRFDAILHGMATIRLQSCSEAEAAVAELGFASVYEGFIARLQSLRVGKEAPRAGAQFPDLSLPDPSGRYRSIQQLQGGRPIVVSFNRGLWCPFCVHELQSWAAASPALDDVGASLVVVTGETGEGASAVQGMIGPRATLLCDVDHGAALACGLAFPVGEDVKRRYLAIGLDLAAIYGSDGGFLPIPATFVVGEDGIIRYAHVDPDFRLRPKPLDIVAFLAAMG
ncbi:peroxiredoxin-like family protein [Sphingomonas sp. Leaf242]|uniref:peroxiredoxin-like family protein n=1 Tax=Sphingomonas sp. Leaf242 TaxID=1736304 RepID=UPI0009E8FF60|nr:peroxiredoxin-like family protein [Sphingomonas sp. Leaf242]